MQPAILEIGKNALYLAMIISAPPLIATLIAGLLVSLLQAITQIQEQTITFVPKLIALFLSLLLFGFWMLSQLVSFTENLWKIF